MNRFIGLVSLVIGVTLIGGCATTDSKMGRFNVAQDRNMVAIQSTIPPQGKVILFLKESEKTSRYKRLDFNY